jgi:hypothetical protein
MTYAERAYFTRDACKHCADRDEILRLKAIDKRARGFIERRKGPRGIRP